MDRKALSSWLLRAVGTVEMLALAAVVMPRSMMEAGHVWLGLGKMPEGEVFEAVMREVSFVYVMHGVGLWCIASDVARYRPLVVLTAAGFLLAAPVFLAIDAALGMPWIWTAGNVGSAITIGGLLSVLLWGDSADSPER